MCFTVELSKLKIFLVPMRLGDTPVPIPNTTVKTKRPMVLHWRRCGRAGGRQIKKEKNRLGNLMKMKQALESESLSETDRQKNRKKMVLNRISWEELLDKLVLPVIRDLK